MLIMSCIVLSVRNEFAWFFSVNFRPDSRDHAVILTAKITMSSIALAIADEPLAWPTPGMERDVSCTLSERRHCLQTLGLRPSCDKCANVRGRDNCDRKHAW